jgi:ElaB/YqjD/DUF883 family membrane-anchored ribosome-binding protein
MVYETKGPGANRLNEPSGLSEGTSGVAAEAKSAAADLGRQASRKMDQVRATAAGSLDTAAGAVHTGGDRLAGAAHSAGDALTSGAQYLREHDARDMIDDLMQVVRNNPGPALLGAVALGFLLGRSLSRG